ncbi:hypothetical protein [Egbenema bharatensis]|uniref:hypothetical protein n=1 Tax=Egbenema bharatensis TaxID=3463334 RepID=UPI003A88CEF0
MAQASPPLRQFIHRLWQFLDSLLDSSAYRIVARRLEASRGWLLALAVLLLLYLWNWPLVVSGGVGLGIMLAVYLVQQGQWQLPSVEWHRFWSRSNRPFTLSVISGVVGCFSTYVSIAIWQEAGGSWVAKGMILEGIGILLILGLLVWQMVIKPLIDRPDLKPEPASNSLLTELANPDPLLRLIAIRRITQQIIASPHSTVHPNASPDQLTPTQTADCFRLMLNRETEPIVCRALVESLQLLKQSSPQASSSASSTAKTTRSPQLQGSSTQPFAPKISEKAQVDPT